MHEERLAKLRKILPNKSSAILILNNHNRYYFGGFMSSAGALLVTRGRAIHLLDGRYFNAVGDCKNPNEIEFMLLKNLRNQLVNLVKNLKIAKIFTEPAISVERLESFKKMFDFAEVISSAKLKSAIENQRIIKNEHEIECIKSAQKITDSALAEVLKIIKPGVSELEIAAEIDYFMKRFGSPKSAFETIVAAGKNSAVPHHVPGNYRVKNGDAILMDFGATFENYCSDMTRTVFLGKPNDEQKSVYNAVLAAQKSAIDVAQSGIAAKDVDYAARSFLETQNLKKCFSHGTGHGAGIYIHEEPILAKSCNKKLKNGMVITIEPGVYLKNKFGVRIEDMLQIVDGGAINLTKSPKNLICL